MITRNTYNQIREDNRTVAEATFAQLVEMEAEGLGGGARSHVLSVDSQGDRGMVIIFAASAIPAIIRQDEKLEGFGWTVDFLTEIFRFKQSNIETKEAAMRKAAQVYADHIHPMPSKWAVV